MGNKAISLNTTIKNISKIRSEVETAVQRSVIDTKRVAPGRVADAVTKRYNLKKSDVNKFLESSGKGTVKVNGVVVENISLLYKSARFTPAAGKTNLFNLTPKERTPGQKKYKVRAQIIRGNKKILAENGFVGEGKYRDKNKNLVGIGSMLPFQRVGKDRLPIKAINTLSMAQMVNHEEVEPVYMKAIQEKLMKSLETRLDKIYEKHGFN